MERTVDLYIYFFLHFVPVELEYRHCLSYSKFPLQAFCYIYIYILYIYIVCIYYKYILYLSTDRCIHYYKKRASCYTNFTFIFYIYIYIKLSPHYIWYKE